MYSLAYNLFLHLTEFALKLFPVRKPKIKLWLEGQKNVFQVLETKGKSLKGCTWFHVASLGEFEQAKPLIEAIHRQFPDEKLVLSFFSASGYERMKDYDQVDLVCYLPLDTKRNVNRFLALLEPKLALFAKYEYWFNYLTVLDQQNIPAILFSAVFKSNHFFFKWYGKAHSRVLKTYDHIFVQNEHSLIPLKSFNKNITVAGDTRVDRSLELPKENKDLPMIGSFKKDQKLLVAGSVWKEDLALLSELIPNLAKWDAKLIIAPHEVDEDHLKEVESFFPSSTRLSNYQKENNYQVLIIDQIGILKYIYKYGDVAFIGGGFGTGIHNTLEPAAFELPIVFGPNYHRFIEAVALKKSGGAFSITGNKDLEEILTTLFENQKAYLTAQQATRSYLNANAGATELILNRVKTYF